MNRSRALILGGVSWNTIVHLDQLPQPVRERMEQEVRVVVSKSNHVVTYSAWGRGGARGFWRRDDSLT